MNIYEIYVKFISFICFKEKNVFLNSFIDITFSGWVVVCLLMFSLKLLVDIPISFVNFVQM